MIRGYAVRLSLSAVAFASIAIVVLHTLGLWPAAILPLDVQQAPDGLYVVHRHADLPLPPPLVDGDVLVLEQMSPAARAAVNYGLGVPRDSSVEIVVSRAGHLLRAPIPARTLTAFSPDWLTRIVNAFVVLPFLAALALLTLWRGRDRVAAGLCGFAFYALVGQALLDLIQIVAAPLLTVCLILILYEGQYVLAIPALYVMAETLAGAGMSRRTRSLVRAAAVCLALAAVSLSLTRELSFIYFGRASSAAVATAINVLTVALMAILVLVLLAGYRRAPHESRLRIRWVLWSTAFLFICVIGIFALEPVQSRYPYLFEFVYTARFLTLGGYLYAAIRTRVVDVTFVVNRALVYAGITGLLFGIFSLVELGLHELAVGDKLSWALQAVTALLLALALSPLHRRLEHWVERIFFHKQRLAIATVRTFAAECAFIEHQNRLLETAVERLHPHCDAVAVYERALSGYQLRAARGSAWPETVDVDDQTFVSLRARRQEVDLRGSSSTIGSDSVAFPMTVGEMLSGAVVCRPRAGEQFAPDVRAALAEAARNLGSSLYILRYREQAHLVADIAAGRVDETSARRRAVAMLEGAT